jgi:hypothetical protein
MTKDRYDGRTVSDDHVGAVSMDGSSPVIIKPTWRGIEYDAGGVHGYLEPGQRFEIEFSEDGKSVWAAIRTIDFYKKD